MNVRMFAGSALATAALGIGVLAGSIASNYVSAQSTTPTTPGSNGTTPPVTNPANPPSTNPQAPAPGMGGPRDFRGGHGDFGGFGPGGPGGMGGFEGPMGGFGPGMGMKSQAATADTANNANTRVTSQITTVKGDLTYATGKMDTTNMQSWLNGADAQVKNAQTAKDASKFEQSVAYARAAGQLAMLAETQMGQTLGFDKLPSASQRPQFPGKMNPANPPTITQAQASRVLERTYNSLVMQKAVLKDGGDVANYLTQAQNAYKTAYDAYNAGKYSDAVSSARVAEELAGVANQIHFALGATSGDQPVTVPAPNF
jgi:hypothetical protein